MFILFKLFQLMVWFSLFELKFLMYLFPQIYRFSQFLYCLFYFIQTLVIQGLILEASGIKPMITFFQILFFKSITLNRFVKVFDTVVQQSKISIKYQQLFNVLIFCQKKYAYFLCKVLYLLQIPWNFSLW